MRRILQAIVLTYLAASVAGVPTPVILATQAASPEAKIGRISACSLLSRTGFKCGGGSRLAIGKSTIGTADEQDQATWRVDDVVEEVAQLRARGVEILDLDLPEMGIKTVDGIADVGHAFAAWFVDPGKNSLSILQFK